MSFRLFLGRQVTPPGTLAGRSCTVSAGVLTPVVSQSVALTGQQCTVTAGSPEFWWAVDSYTNANGTLITNHQADTGQFEDETYPAFAGEPWIQSNRLVAQDAAGLSVISFNEDRSGDHRVRAIFRKGAGATANDPDWGPDTGHVALALRVVLDHGYPNGYYFGYNSTTDTVNLWSISYPAGLTLLATYGSFVSGSNGTSHTFEMRTVGTTSVQIDCYINGALVISYLDSTPATGLQSAQRAGLWLDPSNETPSWSVDKLWWGEAPGAALGTVNLIGQAATVSRGTMVPALDVALTGQAVTVSRGTLAPDMGISAPLTGQVATTQQGALGVTLGPTLTGQAATAAPGALGVAESVGLTGQAATAQPGSVTSVVSPVLTGQAATVSRGTLTPDTGMSGSLAGIAATTSAGTLVPSVAVPLLGAAGTVVQGSIAATLARTLVGFAVTASRGTLTAEVAALLPSMALSVVGGLFTPASVVGLSGLQATVQRGNLTGEVNADEETSIEVIQLFAQVEFDEQVFASIEGAVELTTRAEVQQDLFSESTNTVESTFSIETDEDTVVL